MWWVLLVCFTLLWIFLSVYQVCYPKPRTLVRADLPASWQRHEAPSAEGPVPVWAFPVPSAKARVLICHGYFANRYQVRGIAGRLVKFGFEVMIMELRGHGRRRGPCTFGVKETSDALAILDWAEKQSSQLPVGVLGFSMGCVPMCQAAARHISVKAVVADSVYAQFLPVLCLGLWQEYHLPAIPFGWLTWLGLQCFLRTSLTKVDPINVAQRLSQDLLLIEGALDKRVPRGWVDNWYQRWAGSKERWCEPGAGHVGVFPKDPERYVQRVAAFFERMIV